MDGFFNSESIVVVGVSSSPTNLAKRILFNLQRFRYEGNVYAVGPREEEVEGYPVVRSILDIEEEIDLAVLLVPASNIPEVVEDCGKKGIKRLIIESGGFREFAGDASEHERRMLEICRKYGIRFIGPNCIGVIHRDNGLCTAFSSFVTPFKRGGISVLSQSGGVGISYIGDLTSENVGINKFVSYGNGLDIDEVEVIEYLGQDEKTSLISCYLEGISNGREFMRVVSRLDKPVVVLKSNTQQIAHRIATSHTAAVAGDETVMDAAFRQVGVLRVDNTLVWTNVTKALTLPLMRGNRIAILSHSGGHSVLAADAAAKCGFELPRFPASFFEACEQYFRQSVARLQNPLDLGQILYDTVLSHILEETLKLDEFDGVVLFHSYDAEQDSDETRSFISQIRPLMERYGKPVLAVLSTQRDERQYIRENYQLPLFRSPYHAVQALAYSRDAFRVSQQRRPFDRVPIPKGGEKARTYLTEAVIHGRHPRWEEGLQMMEAYGFPIAPFKVVHSREQALQAADEIGYPVAIKIIHPDAPKKTAVGGVELNLKNEYGIVTGWDEVAHAAKHANLCDDMNCAIVQRMADTGWELFVGAKRDPIFGPVVMAGSGGVLAEVVEDLAVRVAPLSEEDVLDMLSETKAARLLEGFAGSGKADTKALVNLIMTVSQLLIDLDEVEELRLNPVVVHPRHQGITLVDTRIVFREDYLEQQRQKAEQS